MMMKQVRFDIFVYLSILTLCNSQRLLYHCDFDLGLSGACRFDRTPGAPVLNTPFGINSIDAPTQPLSDVKSILSLTTPNNELCILPYNYSSETWSTYFCRENSLTNYTCVTKSGTGNCVIGQYGLVKMTGNGLFDDTYTTVNTVQNHVNSFQCLDLYYYITDQLFGAKISIGWSAGAAPFPITEVTALSENKWQHHRFTYETPRQPSYYIWFQMLRDRRDSYFSFALDEIKIFDGPCDTSTTVEPEIIVSSWQTMSTTTPVSITESTTTSTTSTAITSSTITTITIAILSSSTTSPTINTSTSSTTIASSSSTIAIPLFTTTKESDLPLIIGLGLGLGIPTILIITGALVYYFKVVKPKQKVIVRGFSDDEIPMT